MPLCLSWAGDLSQGAAAAPDCLNPLPEGLNLRHKWVNFLPLPTREVSAGNLPGTGQAGLCVGWLQCPSSLLQQLGLQGLLGNAPGPMPLVFSFLGAFSKDDSPGEEDLTKRRHLSWFLRCVRVTQPSTIPVQGGGVPVSPPCG